MKNLRTRRFAVARFVTASNATNAAKILKASKKPRNTSMVTLCKTGSQHLANGPQKSRSNGR